MMGGTSKGIAKAVGKSAAESFIKAGGKIAAESLQTTLKAALKTSAKLIPKALVEANKEGFEEVMQTYEDEAIQQLYDRTVKDKFHADVTDPKVFAQALEGYIGGAIMGGFG